MLKVKLHKSWRDYFSDSDMNKIRDAINYAIDYHGIRNKKHTVEFHFVDSLKSSVDNKDDQTVGRFVSISIKDSKILLKSTRNVFFIIETIFHEMTHLKHLLCYDLCYTRYGKTWRGEKYPVVDTSKFEEYWNLPDERDARYHAFQMTKKWVWKWFTSKLQFWRKLND